VAPDVNKLIITIDGPAGAGKTTISKALAVRLGYRYLDTGALYRAVAFFVARAGIDADDFVAIQRVCSALSFQLQPDGSCGYLTCNGRRLGPAIRQPDISMLASRLSALPGVRAALLTIQHRLASGGGIVCEGRDMGTVVFPHADIKFFLDADLQIRAMRRFDQSAHAAGQTLNQVRHDLQCRDDQDRQRRIAPLTIADDAIVIDSSRMTSDEVVQAMYAQILRKNGE